MSIASSGNKIVEQSVLNGLCEMDNPSKMINIIDRLNKLDIIREEYCKKHNIRREGLSVLLRLMKSWIVDNEGMTIYQLAGGRISHHTSFYNLVVSLQGKGLIEVSGVSKQRARVYIPSVVTIRELSAMIIAKDL